MSKGQQQHGQYYRIPGLITLVISAGHVVVHGILHDTEETWARKGPDGHVSGDRKLWDWAEACGQALRRLRSGMALHPKRSGYLVMAYEHGVYVRGPHPTKEYVRVECRAEELDGRMEFSGYKELLIDASRPHTMDDAVREVEVRGDTSLFRSDEESSAMDLLARSAEYDERKHPEAHQASAEPPAKTAEEIIAEILA